MEQAKHKTISMTLLCLLMIHYPGSADVLDNAIQSRMKAQDDARQSQNRINSLAGETRTLLDKYRYSIRRTDSLKAYNSQLKKNIENQKDLLTSIQRQLENIDHTKRSIMPLLTRMVRTLEQTVALDIPFLETERKTRIDTIKEMMEQPDVSVPEKYRRIMEAYQIEIEYGRTIETYNDEIEVDGTKQTVEVLRVGRISLVYRTMDGNSCGFWDTASKSWRPLPKDYNHSIGKGIQIARKQSPPDLFDIPVLTPGGSE